MEGRCCWKPSRTIMIYASELASAIGRNRYRPRDETLQKVWLRSHRKSFCFANALIFKDEVVSIVNNFVEGMGDAKAELSLSEDWEKDDGKVVEVIKSIVTSTSEVLEDLYEEILEAMKLHSLQDFQERKLLQTAKVTEHIPKAVESLCKDELKPIQEAAKEVCSKAGVKDEKVLKAIESKLSKDRGTKLEDKAVKTFSEAKGVKVQQKPEILYRKNMEYEGVKWAVCGRTDGVTEDRVIEVKNRTKRFMYPEYDLIQLQTYLFLCDKQMGILLERLGAQNKETLFSFDESSWTNEVTPALSDFVSELSGYIEETKNALYGKREDELPCTSSKRPHDKTAESSTTEMAEEAEGEEMMEELPNKILKSEPEYDSSTEFGK